MIIEVGSQREVREIRAQFPLLWIFQP